MKQKAAESATVMCSLIDVKAASVSLTLMENKTCHFAFTSPCFAFALPAVFTCSALCFLVDLAFYLLSFIIIIL